MNNNKPTLAFSLLAGGKIKRVDQDIPSAISWEQIRVAIESGAMSVNPNEKHNPKAWTYEKQYLNPELEFNALQSMLLLRKGPLQFNCESLPSEPTKESLEVGRVTELLFRQGQVLIDQQVPEDIFGLAITIGADGLIDAYLSSEQALTSDHLNGVRIKSNVGQSDIGVPLLHLATASGTEAILKRLLAHGLDPGVLDDRGRTMAHYVRAAHMVKVIKNADVRVDIIDKNGKSPEGMVNDWSLNVAKKAQLKTAWEKHYPRERTPEDALRELFPQILDLKKTELDRAFKAHNITGNELVDGKSIIETISMKILQGGSGSMTHQALLALWNTGRPKRIGATGYSDTVLLLAAKENIHGYGQDMFSSIPFSESSEAQEFLAKPLNERVDIFCDVGLRLKCQHPLSAASRAIVSDFPDDYRKPGAISEIIDIIEIAAKERGGGTSIMTEEAKNKGTRDHGFWSSVLRSAVQSSEALNHLLQKNSMTVLESMLYALASSKNRLEPLPVWFPEREPVGCQPKVPSHSSYYFMPSYILAKLWGDGVRPNNLELWDGASFSKSNSQDAVKVCAAITQHIMEIAVQAPTTSNTFKRRL
jgi:hypothetical protein